MKKSKAQKIIDNELSGPYVPTSPDSCVILDTIVPDSMDYEIHIATRKIKLILGKSFPQYLEEKLKYQNGELCKALSAEQIDAVALAIYNIEERQQGMIIGDQTGIGKGRVAAAIIRYGVIKGHQPIFLSEKPNLFSDIYRDMVAIGSADLIPFIVNAKESKTDIKDEDGNVVYSAPAVTEQTSIFESQVLPKKYNFVCATYTQFNSVEKKPLKPQFLKAIAADNIIIMDEAHNASGDSNTGNFLQSVIASTKGACFLSATFAKRPDNMPIYAMKTSIKDANMSNEDLVQAIIKGGVALQEVLAAQLVSEGQMIRRERSSEGIEVNYISLDDMEQEHRAIADNITRIMRDIIKFQGEFLNKSVAEMDKIAAAEGKQVTEREGTNKAGVDNTPYFSKIFNVINQMLFSLKADAVADRAILRLQQGKKPVIAFASTMGSFLESIENDYGMPVQDGDTINADFKTVLLRGLQGVLRYTITGYDGSKEYKQFDLAELSPEAQGEYHKISHDIETVSTGLTISPIDVIIQKIQASGFTVAEVTGRKLEIRFSKSTTATVQSRKKLNTNDAFRQFNNNEVDVLMINQSGSTGASAHAVPTKKVPADQVKQRVMIILQAELNISTETQKKGRINRTGQILPPIYDYMSSAIPAEKRLMMMLQSKLKSLDANTSSNQKQGKKIFEAEDFLNKYGDKIAIQFLQENPEFNKSIDDPLKLDLPENEKAEVPENAISKVTGRVAVLPTSEQERFYREISEGYAEYVSYLKQIGEYDLEVESIDLQAVILNTQVLVSGKGSGSVFGTDSILEKCEVNILKKPFTKDELVNIILESLSGRNPKDIQTDQLGKLKAFLLEKYKQLEKETNEKYDDFIQGITEEKAYLKLPYEMRESFVISRTKELNEARAAQIKLQAEKSNNNYMFLHNYFSFFTIGQGYNFPSTDFEQGTIMSKCVFLGYQINDKQANPYAKSALKLRFAVSNSTKYLVVNFTPDQSARIDKIVSSSTGLTEAQRTEIVANWNELIKERAKNRGIRYIITGNILQASANNSGRLISFTTMDGAIKKGILLSENWIPSNSGGSQNVVVPIKKAIKVIKSIVQGNSVRTQGGISIIRTYNGYNLVVPKSKAFQNIYKDQDLIALLINTRDGFEMISGNMVGKLEADNIEKVVNILQDKYSQSLEISSNMYESLVIKDSAAPGNDDLTKQAEKEYADDKIKFDERRHVKKILAENDKTKTSSPDKNKAKMKLKLMRMELELMNV